MMNLLRKSLAALGWVDLVWLRDFDGEFALRVKRRSPFGYDTAQRMRFSIHPVVLLPGGKIQQPNYVKEWKDYK